MEVVMKRKKKHVTFTIDQNIVDSLKEYCSGKNIPISGFVESAVLKSLSEKMNTDDMTKLKVQFKGEKLNLTDFKDLLKEIRKEFDEKLTQFKREIYHEMGITQESKSIQDDNITIVSNIEIVPNQKTKDDIKLNYELDNAGNLKVTSNCEDGEVDIIETKIDERG